MPGTRTDYGQSYDHMLDPKVGWALNSGLALEKALPIASGLTNTVKAGAVVHIAATNVWKPGIHDVNSLSETRVPAFAFQNENDFDVNGDLGNTMGGRLMALVALGAFELESTEFKTDDTYAVGKYLTSDDGSGVAGTGQIKLGALGTNTVVGIISEAGDNANGSFTNAHGVDVIRFYSWFFPKKFV